jgi:hypothetical protein
MFELLYETRHGGMFVSDGKRPGSHRLRTPIAVT